MLMSASLGARMFVAVLCGWTAASPAAAIMQAEQAAPVAEAYSAVGNGISYHNTPNRKHTTISRQDQVVIGTISVTLDRPADVLVQYTSQLATVTKAGCPCSVRASLVADKGTPIVVKRINLAAGTDGAAGYVPDRQPNDGSFVFPLGTGRHEITLIVQQVDGSAETLEAFYANIQALVFRK